MTAALAAIGAAGIALPHLLRLHQASPITALAFWLASLCLRALAGLVLVTLLLFGLPATELFASLTHWCLHAFIPGLVQDVRLEGHAIGDAALFAPGAVLAASLIFACVRTARGARAARHLVDRYSLASGPRGSLIVSGPQVTFAVAGIVRPRILVSAGALASLDDAELAAGLDHERGHIARRHRYVQLTAAALSGLGWMIPGTRRAASEISFHLERDADRWAVRCTDDRLALASVICKAAVDDSPPGSPGLASLGQTGVRERLGQLLDEQPGRSTGPALNLLAVAMVAFTLLLAGTVPAAAVAAAGADAHGAHHGHCEH